MRGVAQQRAARAVWLARTHKGEIIFWGCIGVLAVLLCYFLPLVQ